MDSRPFLNPFCGKEERNGPSSADKGLFTTKPRGNHAICTHPPLPVLPFLLAQKLCPKDIAGSDIQAECCMIMCISHIIS